MTPRRETVTVTGAFEDWTPITVHLTGRISARDRTAPYKGAMFAAHPGDIVFSKIDARNGAIGVLPAAIGPAVVTSEFPVFTPDPTRLDAEFLGAALRTGGFLAALRRKASGTSGRKRVTPEAFGDLHIPLPPLDEQRAMVAAHHAAADRAAALGSEAVAIEAEAARAFEAALGLAPAAALPRRPALIAGFKDMERWSHEGVLRRVADSATASAPSWPLVRLRDVAADLENGWSPQCLNRPAKADEWGVLKLGAVSFGTFDPAENKALPKLLPPRPRLEVKDGQILISRANITRLVGATAIVAGSRGKLMLCDKLFRVVGLDAAQAEPAFLAEVLRTADVRRQIEAGVTGTSPTMKNISKPALLALTFPLPPLADQRAMAMALASARATAARLRTEAAVARAGGQAAFEAALYGAAGGATAGLAAA